MDFRHFHTSGDCRFRGRPVLNAAAHTSECPYRFVVFPNAGARRPLNLGFARGSGRAGVQETPRTWIETATEEDAFIAWVFRQANLRSRNYRACGLRRRLPACLRVLHVASIGDARRVLRRHPQLIHTALDTLLLGVTEFFRYPAVFSCLTDELPRLAFAERPLRIWSVGCSDGAELYSIAMLLTQLNLLDRAELLGTDCRRAAIDHASAGIYSLSAAARSLPAARLRTFFDPPDLSDGARIVRRIRERITWRQSDALTAIEPGPWDLIACRNFAMYLRPAAAERLWRSLASSLRIGGLLVIGKAERPCVPGIRFTSIGPCVFRRDGES